MWDGAGIAATVTDRGLSGDLGTHPDPKRNGQLQPHADLGAQRQQDVDDLPPHHQHARNGRPTMAVCSTRRTHPVCPSWSCSPPVRQYLGPT